ncbi:hypothetical protein [Gloeocapsopsis dulcis]|uniref:hypothetical protein n=1 Tax=Gloeocapsopsis dulcis TaxID=2859516 RepID=UPI0012DA7CAD|nr:hypothetical protein [Gloeocapsopsis dulcis]WNN90077.1 hypothetical protein P0S91_02960 [Gloeocapsopsis dulcis]
MIGFVYLAANEFAIRIHASGLKYIQVESPYSIAPNRKSSRWECCLFYNPRSQNYIREVRSLFL